MGKVVKAVGLTVIALLAPVGVQAQTETICDQVLTDYEYQAGVYEIDYGQGGPDVIIIRNGEIIEEPAEGAPRPPMIRVPTPGLNIITPTPPRRERSDRMPPSTIIPEIKNPKPEPDAEPDQERKENEPEPILN